MKATVDIATLREEVTIELTGNILPYWMNSMMDERHGGFYGRRNGFDELIDSGDKGVILNARILWTFSHASRVLKEIENSNVYLSTAERAYKYLVEHFIDEENGGVYWMVNYEGKPVYTKKQVYAQAFAMYAFSEYYMAAQSKEALVHAISLFKLLEQHSFDRECNGYFEAFDRDWNLLEDLRLSEKDANECKTMNTHLHVLEAYTNLYRCWPDAQLKKQLKNLIHVFFEKIIGEHKHQHLFFDQQWNVKGAVISFGHDIEASWLLQEAAEVSGDNELLEKAKTVALSLVGAVITEGLNPEGALINEIHNDGKKDTDIHWWPQAEALVGFVNAYQVSGDTVYVDKAVDVWLFIKKYVVDNEHGEWHWRLNSKKEIVRSEDKAGPWKCPYHNGRACMELMKRLQDIL